MRQFINPDHFIYHHIEIIAITDLIQDQDTDHAPNLKEIPLEVTIIHNDLRLELEILDLDQEHRHLIDNKIE